MGTWCRPDVPSRLFEAICPPPRRVLPSACSSRCSFQAPHGFFRYWHYSPCLLNVQLPGDNTARGSALCALPQQPVAYPAATGSRSLDIDRPPVPYQQACVCGGGWGKCRNMRDVGGGAVASLLRNQRRRPLAAGHLLLGRLPHTTVAGGTRWVGREDHSSCAVQCVQGEATH